MFLGVLLLFIGLAIAVGAYVGVVGFDIEGLFWLMIPAYLVGTAGLIIGISAAVGAA